MSSSSGSGSFIPPGMFGAATPMPDLPVAGKDSTIGDPYNYGKFQEFLPDIKAEGRNDNATGLRPDMFRYRGPNNPVDGGSGAQAAAAAGGGGGNDLSGQVQGLRDQLAQLQASQQMNNVTWPGGRQRVGSDPIETWVNAS